MFYDLDIPYFPDDNQLPRKLAFLRELGYNVVALNHTMSGKLPLKMQCAIPDPLPSTPSDPPPQNLTILRRVTLVLIEMHPGTRLAELAREYDLFAVRPIDERTLQQACSNIDCDIISIDLSVRHEFYFKHKPLNEAVRAGKKIEIGYSGGIMNGGSGGGAAGMDAVATANARRNLIANATQLIRACRGRGVVLSSSARSVLGMRAPWDVINLSTVWGLSQEQGYEAVSREPRNLVVTARLKRTGYRGVIDVVYGGEKVIVEADGEKNADKGNGRKRKAGDEMGVSVADKPLSKTQMKKRARMEAEREQETKS